MPVVAPAFRSPLRTRTSAVDKRWRHRTLALAMCIGLWGGLEMGIAPAMAFGGAAQSQQQPSLTIPYTRFSLPNGLTVLVHEDRKAPIVSVAVWYHVGSKDEPASKTGFAHLF